MLDASTPSDALLELLTQDADSFTWVGAAVGAQSAAGYQLGSGEPVLAIGGFNGTDPSPTLEEFQQWVADGEVHWFIAGSDAGRGAGPVARRAERPGARNRARRRRSAPG